jgi:hypothetical protein
MVGKSKKSERARGGVREIKNYCTGERGAYVESIGFVACLKCVEEGVRGHFEELQRSSQV